MWFVKIDYLSRLYTVYCHCMLIKALLKIVFKDVNCRVLLPLLVLADRVARAIGLLTLSTHLTISEYEFVFKMKL